MNRPEEGRPLILSYPYDTSRFFRAIGSDDIGAVIRVHFEIDGLLSHIISKYIRYPKKMKLNYTGQKIDLLSAMGFPDIFIAPIKTINKIRNTIGHDGIEEIPAELLKRLFNEVSEVTGGKFTEQFTVNFTKENSELVRPFSELSAREKFCVLSYTAASHLDALHVKVRDT